MKPIKPDCSEQVFRGWHYYPCSRKASVEVDGRHYCGTHNPITRAAMEERREADYREKSKARNAQWNLHGAAPEMLAVLKLLVEGYYGEDGINLKSVVEDAIQAIAKAEGRA